MAEEDATRHRKMHTGLTDQQTTAPTERTTVEGGHQHNHLTHHHIHESIQPVIQRETVAPSVTHTTKNIHEHITDQPIVHDQTVEPTLSINQFKDKVSGLTGGHATSHHDHMKPNVVPHESSGNTGTGTGMRGAEMESGSNRTGAGMGTNSGVDGLDGDLGAGTRHTGTGKTGTASREARNIAGDVGSGRDRI
jgi:hypothetical protein